MYICARKKRPVVRSLLLLGCLLAGAVPLAGNSLVPALAASASGQSGETVIRVTNSAQLQRALNNPQGGFVVSLAPGNYGTLRLGNGPNSPNYARRVVIRSEDPCNPARLQLVYLKGVSNLEMEGLLFERPNFFNRPRQQVLLSNGRVEHMSLLRTDHVQNFVVRNSRFVGPTTKIAGGHPTNGYGHGFGWHGLHMKNVSALDNQMSNTITGINFSKSQDVKIVGNSMHDYRSDAFQLTDIKNLTVLNNRMVNPRPYVLPNGAGDHPDFIQLANVDNGRVENNYMDIGTAAEMSQGIFASGYVRGTTVRNNIIATRAANALRFAELSNSTISNNLVVHAESPSLRNAGRAIGATYEPRISIRHSYRNVRITNNLSSGYDWNFEQVARQNSDIHTASNALLQNNAPQLLNYFAYNAAGRRAPAGLSKQVGNVWLGQTPAGVGPDWSKFDYLSQGESRMPARCQRR